MYKQLWKTLWHSVGSIQIATFSISSAIGLIIVLFSVSCVWFFKETASQNSELFAKDYIVVAKKVTTLQTLTKHIASFSDREIKNIQKQDFIKSVEPFYSSQFYVQIRTGGTQFPVFKTDIFFEAIPDTYLRSEVFDWHWDSTQNIVPIVFPQSFLSLYNYGYAPGQGLPQLSESLFSKIPLQVHIAGNGRQAECKARVVGFSKKIHTILVPLSFLQWANHTFSTTPAPAPTRLILDVEHAAQPEIIQYMHDKNLQPLDASMLSSKLSLYLKLSLAIVGGVGLLIVALAVWLLIFSFLLLVEKNKDKILQLWYLGYTPKQIIAPYTVVFTVIISTISIVAASVVWRVLHTVHSKLLLITSVPLPSFGIFISIASALTILLLALQLFIISNRLYRLMQQRM